MSILQSSTLLQSLTLQSGKPQTPSALPESYPPRYKSAIARLLRFARHPIENVGEVVEDWYDGTIKEERIRRQSLEDRKQLLYLKLREAPNHEEWQAVAVELDRLEGNNDWKAIYNSPDYDPALVEARLKQLDEARTSCDVGRMLFLVRTALTRNLGNMGNIKLYKHSHNGTKDLIEAYISSALATLNALLDVSAKCKCDGRESKYILEQVLFARQAFGRSALLLSGGATFGMNHIGVLKALWEARLLPRIISGASAGSIVCAALCTRTDEEIPDLLANFCYGDLAVFEGEGSEHGLLGKVARFLKFGAMFDISHLTRVMKELLGEMTFQESYNRTRKILNICVSSASLYELPRLLNYITAPNVLIWSAVAASCSVPFVFSAATILAKDPKTGEAVPWNPSPQHWIDGSVDNDLPMTRLAEMFNVNHFIVSQVNPHVVPFLLKEEDVIAPKAQRSASTAPSAPAWLHTVTHLGKDEALHRMRTLAEIGIFPNALTKAVSVLSQKYSGDITILPEISYSDFPRMLSNPTLEFMATARLCGERATWPKLSRIRNHCAIELALDDAVQKLRARVVFSPSQVDLRISVPTRSRSNPQKEVKGRRRQRPLSQNSAPAAAPPFQLNPTKFLKTRSHRKSRSTTTNRDASELLATAALPSIPTQDIPDSRPSMDSEKVTSSDADEASNLPSSRNSSSSTLSVTSPFDSLSPPPSSPTKANDGRPLFFSASQPTTPSGHHHGWDSTSSARTSVPPPRRSTRDSPVVSANFLTMTPSSTVQKSGEPRQERHFHPPVIAVPRPPLKVERSDNNAHSPKLPFRLVGAAKWGFDDATVSVHGKKAGVGGGVKEKLVENKALPGPIVLGASDTLKLLLTTTEDKKPKRPHQAFLLLREPKTNLDTSFPLSVKESGKGKLELSHKDLPTQFLASSNTLSASLIIASFGTSTPYRSPAFDLKIEFDPSAPPPAAEKPLRYGKLPEIHHIFKPDPKSPPKIITLFFTAAVIATLPALCFVVSF
ncbi:MAG: hypothetical protein LQ338_003801 [Usnochroma carphineum]|nr:MAG: hypothetical protein LQ338_003801 [Usnochroma carphineum]